MSLEQTFQQYRKHIIGERLRHTINGQSRDILYADWTASGRLYQPIEDFISQQLGPYVANTHTETNLTGTTMTHAYHQAQHIIKRHVNANDQDVLIAAGSGMTTVINKLQRILGLRIAEKWQERINLSEEEKPVVFITHMEHHSNQTTWNTCEVTVEVIHPDPRGLPDKGHLLALLELYQDRPLKIGAFTACSNVTGIKTDYHGLAKIMHQHGGLCFVDFACSAPYVDIDMHPDDEDERLDAIFFSPHKFLGGPGSSGVMVFNRKLYANKVPDQPGGGTVRWTNPWGGQGFYDDIETREDGGTPAFLQTIKVALAIQLKEQMGTQQIAAREQQLVRILMDGLAEIPQIQMLEPNVRERLCVVSFYVTHMHYNLVVRLLNDKFGIQVRGGCSCAGTYGHILLNVDQNQSCSITNKIDAGDLSDKPGWIRVSLHPTNTDAEARFIVKAIRQVVENADKWRDEYRFDPTLGDYVALNATSLELVTLEQIDLLPTQAVAAKSSMLKRVFTGLRLKRETAPLQHLN